MENDWIKEVRSLRKQISVMTDDLRIANVRIGVKDDVIGRLRDKIQSLSQEIETLRMGNIFSDIFSGKKN